MSEKHQALPLLEDGRSLPLRSDSLPQGGDSIYGASAPQGYGSIELAASLAAPQRRQSSMSRFIRLILSFSVTLLLVHCNIVVIKHLLRLRRQYGASPDYEAQISSNTEPGTPAHRCVEFANWTTGDGDDSDDFSRVALTSFELPLSSDLLYLISNGTLSLGTLRISDRGSVGSDSALVDISMTYHFDYELEHTTVCLLNPEQGQYGVGFFNPGKLPDKRRIRTFFDVRVELPPGSRAAPTFVQRFETKMPQFVHEVAHSQDSVLFGNISLITLNMPIIAQSLVARHATLQTLNARIEGSITTFSRLNLLTLNAPIHVDVKMLNADDGDTTELQMLTANAAIDSTVELISTSADGTGGAFMIHAVTINQPLSISTRSAPVDHVLNLTAQTNFAKASVVLHPTWEGAFHLETTPLFNTPTVEARADVPDPAGRGRMRSVEFEDVGGGVVGGRVEWVSREESRRGLVNVSTTIMPLTLHL
ncbi:hypothetical protein OBBRIDRAFT_749519 [Obba rivulosa]|uniref:Uncharacterized protein n=1 Tax=Obba rivulosa TaxID=1052685 RepID=A0A8E2J2W8_9APHY|nr:hypothetical protein OBBRIDRAFT_749519 [Obba rivulosa]